MAKWKKNDSGPCPLAYNLSIFKFQILFLIKTFFYCSITSQLHARKRKQSTFYLFLSIFMLSLNIPLHNIVYKFVKNTKNKIFYCIFWAWTNILKKLVYYRNLVFFSKCTVPIYIKQIITWDQSTHFQEVTIVT